MEFKVSAPGKIILYGEHAVVYGKTAVASALDIRTTLEFKEVENEALIRITMPKIELDLTIPFSVVCEFISDENNHKTENSYVSVQNFVEKISYSHVEQRFALQAFFYLLMTVADAEKIVLRPFRVILRTSLAISAGLGSSASFAVCIATCFLHLAKLQRNETLSLEQSDLEKISDFALRCEKIMHGQPSGVDNSVCTYGSVIKFRRGERLEPIAGVRKMKVLLVDTRVQRSTKALVEKLADLKRRYPSIFNPVLEAIDSTANQALEVLKNSRSLPADGFAKSYDELMTLMEVNQSLLASCQVSHPSLDRICAEAKNYGLAGKLTGAGGGGFAYILLPPDTPIEKITSITNKLIANGFLVTLTELGGPGVQIHER